MNEAVKMIHEKASIYVPQTIGARDSSLSAVLGMFYAYRDINVIRNSNLLVADEQVILESIKVNKSHGNEET